MGKSARTGTSNRERERKRAHGAQSRRREEREKGAQISVALSWFSRTLDARNSSAGRGRTDRNKSGCCYGNYCNLSELVFNCRMFYLFLLDLPRRECSC